MIKIEIKKAEYETITGTGKQSGKPFTLYKQVAYAHLAGEPYPVRIEILLDSRTGHPQPYQVGAYQLSPDSFRVSRFGSLELGDLKLIPLKAAAAA